MKIVDLTMPIAEGMPVYPGDPEVRIEKVHAYGTHTWELRRLTLGTHTGTHVDAFSHMHEGAASIDRIPLEQFIGPAQVVRPDGPWPAGCGLLFAQEIGLEALARLAEARPPFVGGELTEELERELLRRDIVTYTSLVRLEELPPETEFLFCGLPLPIRDGDGSPVRAVAVFF